MSLRLASASSTETVSSAWGESIVWGVYCTQAVMTVWLREIGFFSLLVHFVFWSSHPPFSLCCFFSGLGYLFLASKAILFGSKVCLSASIYFSFSLYWFFFTLKHILDLYCRAFALLCFFPVFPWPTRCNLLLYIYVMFRHPHPLPPTPPPPPSTL